MENLESFQFLEQLILQGALIVFFFAILWTLGERDRLKILKLLHKALHLLEINGEENGKSIQKGGDSHVSDDRKDDNQG